MEVAGLGVRKEIGEYINCQVAMVQFFHRESGTRQ